MKLNPLVTCLVMASRFDKRGMYRAADTIAAMAESMVRTANEYWLRDGRADFADGDIGDANHEMYAEEELLNRMGFDLGDGYGVEGPLTREYANEMLQNNIKSIDDYNEHLKKLYEDDENGLEDAYYEADLYDYLLWRNLQLHPEKDPQLVRQEVDQAWAGFKDPRTHAIKNFGWHRVQGNHIETYTLNQRVLDEIADGLRDAYDEDVDGMKFYIDVHEPRKYIGPVTIDEIEDGSVLRARLEPDAYEPVGVKRKPKQDGYYNYIGD